MWSPNSRTPMMWQTVSDSASSYCVWKSCTDTGPRFESRMRTCSVSGSVPHVGDSRSPSCACPCTNWRNFSLSLSWCRRLRKLSPSLTPPVRLRSSSTSSSGDTSFSVMSSFRYTIASHTARSMRSTEHLTFAEPFASRVLRIPDSSRCRLPRATMLSTTNFTDVALSGLRAVFVHTAGEPKWDDIDIPMAMLATQVKALIVTIQAMLGHCIENISCIIVSASTCRICSGHDIGSIQFRCKRKP
mmetsp:Transcript_67650/g.174297  ORF Transcript_67650/g.174297 Transcript_67650/m.174297 type:complete len:244 (+) Transcript_67650:166-897(+)